MTLVTCIKPEEMWIAKTGKGSMCMFVNKFALSPVTNLVQNPPEKWCKHFWMKTVDISFLSKQIQKNNTKEWSKRSVQCPIAKHIFFPLANF